MTFIQCASSNLETVENVDVRRRFDTPTTDSRRRRGGGGDGSASVRASVIVVVVHRVDSFQFNSISNSLQLLLLTQQQ